MHFDDWMSASDAILWYMERDPHLRSTVTSVWLLDRASDPDRFRKILAAAPAAVPRLTQRVVSDPIGAAPPRWVADPHFDLDAHVHHRHCRDDVLRGTDSTRALLDLAGHLHEHAFDRERSPWEINLIDGLADGHTAVVVKVHHAIADGNGLLQMIGALVELDREPTHARATAAEMPSHGGARTGAEYLGEAIERRVRADVGLAWRAGVAAAGGLTDLVRHPLGTARQAIDTAASVGHLVKPAPGPLSSLMTERSLTSRFDVLVRPLPALKAAARATGGSLNDVFVAAAAGGVHRYHELHGHATPRVRINMPISIRRGPNAATAGNQFVPARFVIPIDAPDPRARVATLRAHLARERAQPALPLMPEISEMISRMGSRATTLVLGQLMKSVDLVASNVAGPEFDLFTAGARIEHMFAFGPCAGAAMNVTLLTYRDEAVVGVNSDRAAIPDPDDFMELLAGSLDEILALG